MTEENDPAIPIYRVGEYVFCQRAAFHYISRNENPWRENPDYQTSKASHTAIDQTEERRRSGGTVERGRVRLYSRRLGLTGIADLVVFESGGDIYPVEYKKGAPGTIWLNHKVQLCLQALCLEEMYSCRISHGFLYYFARHHRQSVEFDNELRTQSEKTVAEFKGKLAAFDISLFARANDERCAKCSFAEICLPSYLYSVEGEIDEQPH